MLGTAVASPPPLSVSTNIQPSHPVRTRHRGLSYLRAYTQNRLSSSSNPTSPSSPSHSRSSRLSLSRTHSHPRSPEPTTESPPSPQAALPSQRGVESVGEIVRAAQESTSAAVQSNPLPGSSTTPLELPNPTNPIVEGADGMARSKIPSGARATDQSAASATNTQGDIATQAVQAAGISEEIDDNGPPTIRFFPHQELPSSRPSLHFPPMVRTLPSTSSVIKVGRYSEREGVPIANPTAPSDAPVGFKSKVVSRKHCEFSFQNGAWYIKDVASSSGTFLNHVRLSQPNQVSRLFPVKDGDVVQLGIDFRGGEEMIFRCVKIRIECNRSWQQKPNKFNQERHARLLRKKQDSTATKAPGSADLENSGECSICLSSVMPCQSLFVAPCAHVWHFKCIYPLLVGKRYPHFGCPNCRAVWNLEAEVDNPESEGEWEDPPPGVNGTGAEEEDHVQSATTVPEQTNTAEDTQHIGAGAGSLDQDGDTAMISGHLSLDESISNDEQSATLQAADISRLSSQGLLARRQASSEAPAAGTSETVHDIDLTETSQPMADETSTPVNITRVRSPALAPDVLSGEGPLTPRNNAGPFVFDGSAGRDRRSQNQPLDDAPE